MITGQEAFGQATVLLLGKLVGLGYPTYVHYVPSLGSRMDGMDVVRPQCDHRVQDHSPYRSCF